VKIKAVIPVYQNVGTLRSLFEEIRRTRAFKSGDLSCIFVDDGSTDDSYLELLALQTLDPERVEIIKLSRNFGQIAALQAGLRHALGSHVVIISADLQDPPSLIDSMIEKLVNETYFVIAEREGRAESGLQALSSEIYWWAVGKFALKGYPRGGFDYCLLHRQLAEVLAHFPEKNTQIFPLIYYMGYRPHVIKYFRQERGAGKSQWTLSKKVKLFLDTFIAFSFTPIRAVSLVGFLTSVASIGLAAVLIIQRIVNGNPYPGWTSLAVLLLFLGGAILLTLGLMGEYLWRILDQVRPRPHFVVECVISASKEKIIEPKI
jgi:glycosyltransferase involved in cell wall biosynthesis